MDTLKVGPYCDAPDNLEKGCTEAQPLRSESCQACSVQTRGRRSFVKHPWIIFSVVTLVWLVFSYGKRAFKSCQPHHAWV